ncbi:MAG: hypothetical protein KAY37_05750 [Phycisphaerae bacterium]|nr:hypothetical protein [Phycisphaerae bacterium]
MNMWQAQRHRARKRGWGGIGLGLGGVLAVGLLLSGPLAAQSPSASSKGAVIPIRGIIDDIMRDSIERRLDEARQAGATTIIFEMDTPGGMVSSALDIFRIIERHDGRTVAWVNPEAYSAGALISVACDEIWMSPSSSIGDCAPIVMAPTGGVQELGETERAKAESPILQKFRDAAARNGYNQALSRAMVAVGEEVWWLEKVDDGTQRRFVSGEEKQKLIDEVEEDEREWKLVESYVEADSGRDYPVAQPVDRADTLLTMSQSEAVAFGFARGTASSPEELAGMLEISAALITFETTGWEKFAAWLNSPLVRGILLVIVMLGAYIEFQSPGLILPGATALVALAIFLAAPYAAGLATVWPIILLVLGLILLGVEIFVLPGFGIAGLIGVALILVAIIASFVPAEPELPPFALPSMAGVGQGLLAAIKVVGSSVAVSVAGILLLIRYLPESKVAAGVVTANPDADAMALSDAHPTVAQIGDVGVVTGDLRPGGQARFGQEIVDVHSQQGYVEAGWRVQVIRREGMHIEVRPLPEEEQA